MCANSCIPAKLGYNVHIPYSLSENLVAGPLRAMRGGQRAWREAARLRFRMSPYAR